MLKYFLSLFFLIHIQLCEGQITQVQVDSIVNNKCQDGLYVSASNLLVDFANDCYQAGDLSTALQYQLKNINLVDDNYDYFVEHDMTNEIYLSNWQMISLLYGKLGKMEDFSKTFVFVMEAMNPNFLSLIPNYLCGVAPSLALCSDNYLPDPKKYFVIALDEIIKNNFTKDGIDQFNYLIDIYEINRIRNNCYIDNTYLYEKYMDFIISLDSITYKDLIFSYRQKYIKSIESCAMIASNTSNNFESIYYYHKLINELKKEKEDIQVNMRIASYYAKIGSEYYILGDWLKTKEYTDKAVKNICYKEESLDYCRLLDGLALNYWNVHQFGNAAKFKEIELQIREKTELKPSVSDYGVLMMYSQNDTLKTMQIGQALDNKYDSTEIYMDNIYMYLADAYSKIAHKYYKNNNEKLKNENSKMAEYYIHNAKLNIENNKEWYRKIGGINGHYYNYNTLLGNHYRRFNNLDSALYYYQEALKNVPNANKENIVVMSSYLNNKKNIGKYLPEYYKGLESDIKSMLPLLGTVESALYLMQGEHSIYKFPEFASWNPSDSICVTSAYNSALLSKDLYMKFSSFASIIGQDKVLNSEYKNLMDYRNKIQLMPANNERLLALYDYEFKERELRNKFPEIITSNLDVDWRKIQNNLDEKEVAIEFFEYKSNDWDWLNLPVKNHYIALVLDKNNEVPIIVDLFNQEDIIDVYNLQPKSYGTDIGHEMYEQLWGQLHPYIKNASTVFFSPMGLLSLINLEALMDENGVSAFEHYNLKRVSSTRELLEKTDKKEIKKIALFGGINYTSQDSPVVFSIDSLNTRGNWSFLTNTLNEINTIQDDISKYSNIRLATYKGFEATESTFKKICEEYPEIIHIASHGFYINETNRSRIPYYQSEELTDLKDNLFYSGLIFAYGQDSWNNETFKLNVDDGILTSYEISQMNLHDTNLVVLSACETGVGDRDFDGIVGLQRAFKMAGVKTIIMSLWKVDDEATALMMTTFYKELLRTGSKHEAFVYAQKVVKQKYEDPYFWASFIMLD